jgi:hypothetical protein
MPSEAVFKTVPVRTTPVPGEGALGTRRSRHCRARPGR